MAFYKTKYKEAPILRSTLLDGCPELFHAFFLKGTPLEALSSLLELPVYPLQQIHSRIVEEAPPQRAADALVTQKKELPLMIKHADCQAALFWDPKTQTLAAAHAGWRGLVEEIYTAVVLKLKEEYGVDPAHLLCAVGPSIGPDHAEFQGWRDYFPPRFAPFEVKPDYFDLRAVARAELEGLGLHPSHIDIAEACTVCDPELLHSYRRDKTAERLMTVGLILNRTS